MRIQEKLTVQEDAAICRKGRVGKTLPTLAQMNKIENVVKNSGLFDDRVLRKTGSINDLCNAVEVELKRLHSENPNPHVANIKDAFTIHLQDGLEWPH